MSVVLTERINRSLVITINRPEARNALTMDVLSAITDALAKAANEPHVRCIVLTGAGGHFCSGADLRAQIMSDPEVLNKLDTYMTTYHGVIRAIVKSPKVIIAAMDGCAVGFGADLALACDLRVAGEAAYVQEKFVQLGLMPDGGGSFWLPRLVGTARALRMILLAEKVTARELLELDVVHSVVPSGDLMKDSMILAAHIEAGPPLAFAAIRRSIYASWGDIDAALDRERTEQIKLLKSADVMEGVMAWAQKRSPVFNGE